MTITKSLQQAGERFRHAVASGSHAGAESALAEYARQVEAVLADASVHGGEPAALRSQTDELMQWALQVVRAARVQARDQLEQVSAALGYHEAAPQSQTWELDG